MLIDLDTPVGPDKQAGDKHLTRFVANGDITVYGQNVHIPLRRSKPKHRSRLWDYRIAIRKNELAGSKGLFDISYRYEVDAADYTITLPNSVVFNSAPASGTITADFQFYYACRFVDDSMDFEKFADKLWNLQSVQFKSIIQ